MKLLTKVSKSMLYKKHVFFWNESIEIFLSKIYSCILLDAFGNDLKFVLISMVLTYIIMSADFFFYHLNLY